MICEEEAMTEETKYSKKFMFRTTPRVRELLSQRAVDDGISMNEVMNKAAVMYLTKDTMEESLLIAKLSDIQNLLGRMKRRDDLREKFELDVYQFLFTVMPELPEESRAGVAVLERGKQRFESFLKGFRRRVSALKPVMETVFGDMLEEDAGKR